MRALIEKETALHMHEIVLYCVVFVSNIHDRRQTVNVQYSSCDNNAFLYTHYKFIEPAVSSVAQRTRYRCGRSGVQILGRSNVANGSPPLRRSFGAV